MQTSESLNFMSLFFDLPIFMLTVNVLFRKKKTASRKDLREARGVRLLGKHDAGPREPSQLIVQFNSYSENLVSPLVKYPCQVLPAHLKSCF